MLFRIDPENCVTERLDLGSVWRNASGHVRPLQPDDLEKSALLFDGDSFKDFEVIERALYYRDRVAAEDTTSGWISPEGDYYGCAATASKRLHFMEYVLGRNAIESLREGWIEVSGHGWSQDANCTPGEAQRRTLQAIGRDPENRHVIAREVAYQEAFPAGNPAMDALYERLNGVIGQESERLAKPAAFQPQTLAC